MAARCILPGRAPSRSPAPACSSPAATIGSSRRGAER